MGPRIRLFLMEGTTRTAQTLETLSHGGGTFTDAMPAAAAASMPMSVSSKTMQASALTPSRAAAIRKASGSGYPLL
jgi:hypothetical protein